MSDLGKVKFIKPKDPLLKKWIKGYYVHKSKDHDFYCKLTFYQNITTTISIYHDSISTSKGRYRKVHHQKGRGFKYLLAALVDKYQEVEFFGPLDRLAIVFYPCDINHFMNEALGPHVKRHYSWFNYFKEDFDSLIPEVYHEEELDKKRNLLDNFFLNRFHDFKDKKLLSAVDLLVKSKGAYKVGDLAEELELSRRTLLRKFKRHLAYSVEEYISVIKFRSALNKFQSYQGNENLTRIALESNYYDQADINHHVKNRSDLTPSQLFEQLKIVDNTLFWKL